MIEIVKFHLNLFDETNHVLDMRMRVSLMT